MKNLKTYLGILILPLFFLGTIFLTHADVSANMGIPLSGLAAMRSMAKQSIPYEVAATNGKPSLIEFYADWCSTCQSLAPSLNNLHQQYGENVNFVMLNVDDPIWSEQIKNYGASSIPYLVFVTAELEVKEVLVGKPPEKVIEPILISLSNRDLGGA
ncbi:MAG: thioredoxin domain-containing protein [Cyanobacteriota bacterium]|nr:thioredoxin domain-containing protein [Cyanobacteriota bacterium]